MKNIALVLLLMVPLLLPAGDAMAVAGKPRSEGESYAVPSYEELAQTTLLLGGMDINENAVADEYARILYCKLYKENYRDDFSWNNVRRDLVTRILSKRETFRTQYEILGTVELGRYNFEAQEFPFVEGTALTNVGVMNILEAKTGAMCGQGGQGSIFPEVTNLVLSKPLTFEKYKIPMDEAEKLLDTMKLLKIGDRRLYIRFRFKVQSVARVPRKGEGGSGASPSIDLNGVIESVDLFFDREATQPVAKIPLDG